MDLSNFSDEELEKIAAQKKPKQIDLSHYTDEELEAIAGSKPSFGEKAQATLEGFGQAGTFGYLPQLQSVVGGLIPNPSKDVDEKLKAQGFTLADEDDSYVARRDKNIERQEGYAKEMPAQYYGGQVAGLLATAPASAGLIAKAPGMAVQAGKLGRLGQAATAGALQSAVQNPGDVKGEVNLLQLEDRAKNAAVGGLLGGAVQGGVEAAKGVAKIPGALKEFGQQRALKASGATVHSVKRIFKNAGMKDEAVKELGEYIVKNKYIQPGDSIEDIYSRVQASKNDLGQKIGDLYESANQRISKDVFGSLPPTAQKKLAETAFKPKQLGSEFLEQIKNDFTGKQGGKKALQIAESEIADLLDNPETMSLAELNNFRKSIDQQINFAKKSQEASRQDVLEQFRNFITEKVQKRLDVMDEVLGTNELDALKKLNQQYNKTAKVAQFAEDGFQGEVGRNWAGFTDSMLAGGGFIGGVGTGIAQGKDPVDVLGQGLMGSGIGVASKFGRKYGTPAITYGAYKTGDALQRLIPQRAQGLLNQATPFLTGSTARLNQPDSLPPRGLLISDKEDAKKRKPSGRSHE